MIPFPDPRQRPTHAAVLEALGPASERWRGLEAWLLATYGLEGEPVYFGRDTGWAVRYRRGGKALLTLIPGDRRFRAMVVVGPSAWTAVEHTPLAEATRLAWDAARPYPDGRWLWLDVAEDDGVEDIERLVALKSPPPRRPRPADPTLRGWTTG